MLLDYGTRPLHSRGAVSAIQCLIIHVRIILTLVSRHQKSVAPRLKQQRVCTVRSHTEPNTIRDSEGYHTFRDDPAAVQRTILLKL